jgi:hypothetical protein
MLKVWLVAALAVAVSAPALAVDKDSDEGTAATTKEKKICRTEAITGSLIGKRRVCMTEKEWAHLQAETKRGMDRFQDTAAGGANIANNPGPGG